MPPWRLQHNLLESDRSLLPQNNLPRQRTLSPLHRAQHLYEAETVFTTTMDYNLQLYVSLTGRDMTDHYGSLDVLINAAGNLQPWGTQIGRDMTDHYGSLDVPQH
ncbi:uncharacterized protein SEPMUDRAFT_148382 [Sphaerulina musiva SO2202]|uniref:Uncharacterized protein n=1 Tax=Sphaerulina musiva (strain SO2202) TaxID=692275 RepID=M3C3A3_SPHMS|nr:uncharacterized protein SEPMUDRAFT_148382 [Sphaerulina musiva SO2202]EMF14766.1 hypothetical protein SEPMUDRAFT_148382 [Sphaerulina musiva SO2202]